MIFIAWGLGILVGVIVSTVIFIIANHKVGILKIDHHNPEKDIYRFDIDDLDKLSKKKRIVLKVDNNANLSQK